MLFRILKSLVAELFPRCPLFSGRDAELLSGMGECIFAGKPDQRPTHNTLRSVIEQKNVAESVF